jgi:predicted small secreted protein
MVRKFMIALGITALGISATACNTVKGAGEDIESVGEAGSDAIGNR